MKAYKTKVAKLGGTSYSEVYPKALRIYKEIRRKTKRRPYVRSAYFNKDKIFLDYFWEHLHQKNLKDKIRRAKYYPCAIELITKTKYDPVSVENPNDASEILHRFAGITADEDLFFVQIKEKKKNNQKFFLSVFPEDLGK